jgi:hypothetical protein
MAWIVPIPPSARHPHERYQVCYQDGKRHRSAGILPALSGPGISLTLQRVPEAKTVKNRMHIDLLVDDVPAEVDRLESLGATRMTPAPHQKFDQTWYVMADRPGRHRRAQHRRRRSGHVRRDGPAHAGAVRRARAQRRGLRNACHSGRAGNGRCPNDRPSDPTTTSYKG